MPTSTESSLNHGQTSNHSAPVASPRPATAVSLPNGENVDSNHSGRMVEDLNQGFDVILPLNSIDHGVSQARAVRLELQDGGCYQGYSFGAERSISGELVFQTGMVGYPESITDPSYRGQILVITFPLIGNYGVPSRKTSDELLDGLPAHFEASEIHVAGLIVASYSGEDYSHHLATSSLGTWLKEQNVPAMYGVDTRALTKQIREQGSMLGKLLMQIKAESNGFVNGDSVAEKAEERLRFDQIDWIDPNAQNLVADGESPISLILTKLRIYLVQVSLDQGTSLIQGKAGKCPCPLIWKASKDSLCGCWLEIQPVTLSCIPRR